MKEFKEYILYNSKATNIDIRDSFVNLFETINSNLHFLLFSIITTDDIFQSLSDNLIYDEV